jgi:hypothetical protein
MRALRPTLALRPYHLGSISTIKRSMVSQKSLTSQFVRGLYEASARSLFARPVRSSQELPSIVLKDEMLIKFLLLREGRYKTYKYLQTLPKCTSRVGSDRVDSDRVDSDRVDTRQVDACIPTNEYSNNAMVIQRPLCKGHKCK